MCFPHRSKLACAARFALNVGRVGTTRAPSIASSALVVVLACVHCSQPPPGAAEEWPLPATASVGRPGRESAPLPSRAEVVARADALAVSSAKLGGVVGAKLAMQAPALPRRISRVPGQNADALPA